MDPEREGYVSLEEETTTPTPQRSVSPSEVVTSPPTPAEEEAALSDGSSAELVETGLPEEPCFYGHGSAWNNRQWCGWKPRDTPRMPPKRRVSVEQQHSSCLSSPAQVDRQPRVLPRGIEHEEFCRDMNGLTLPRDREERENPSS